MNALLLSGGMDSIAIAWWKRPDLAIFVDYGQIQAKAEEAAGRAVADEIGIRYEIVRADCSSLGSGDMAGQKPLDLAPVPEWWPFRNQLILTLAGMAAVRSGATNLMIGSIKEDSQHTDGKPEFIDAMSKLMSLQEGGLTVEAPAIALSAVDLVLTSGVPNPILSWAHSCHVSNYACGSCRGCLKHFDTLKRLNWDAH